MKKVFLIIFAATFVLGICAYWITSKKSEFETIIKYQPKIKVIMPEKSFEATKSGILEENTDWENDYESKFTVKLLEIGEGFHGDQVDAKNGEVWLELFRQGDRFYLEETKLKIIRVRDEIVDDNKNQKTGKSVNSKNGENSILLLKNADFLKKGEIETLFCRKSQQNEEVEEDFSELYAGFNREFTTGTNKFLLSVKKGVNKQGEKIISLILGSNGIKQTLHSYKDFNGDSLGNLYWVGDLDKDGKPDFYFDLFVNENVEYKSLFLSSKAEKGKLLKKVGIFRTTGC